MNSGESAALLVLVAGVDGATNALVDAARRIGAHTVRFKTKKQTLMYIRKEK